MTFIKKKSWIPLLILVGIVIFILIFSFFWSDIKKIRSPMEPSTGCVVMKDRGNYEDSIDIVFLAENYKDVSKFVEDTEKMMERFLEVIPYNNYPDRFNFFRIENLDLDFGCKYEDDAVVCDPSKTKKASMDCPFDYSIVSVSINGIENLFFHLRSSAWRGIAAVNAADDPLVFAHEFAHISSKLLDEYTWEGGKIWIEGPNCDKDFETCPKFQEVEGSECHVGCVNFEHSRPVDVGIMRDYWKSDSYGVYNEHIIENFILGNSLSSEDVEKDEPLMSPVSMASYGCDGKGSCKILNIEEGNGIVSEYLQPYSGYENYAILKVGAIEMKFDNSQGLIIEGHDENKKMVGYYKEVPFSDIAIFPTPEKEVDIFILDPEGNEITRYEGYVPSRIKSNGRSAGIKKRTKIINVKRI